MELYPAVRLAVVDEGLSHHEACCRFGIDRRTAPVRRPKLDGFTGVIGAILEADRAEPRKQRHPAHRIFERLRDEHGFTGGYTIVKDYVRSRWQSAREAFVPLHQPPGHAQVDFGEAVVDLRGQREKVAFYCLILPHSNVWFVVRPVGSTPIGTVPAFPLNGRLNVIYWALPLAGGGQHPNRCRWLALAQRHARFPFQHGAQTRTTERAPRDARRENACQTAPNRLRWESRISAAPATARNLTTNQGRNTKDTQHYQLLKWVAGCEIRTHGMLCVPLCFFGVFSALQALGTPRQTGSL